MESRCFNFELGGLKIGSRLILKIGVYMRAAEVDFCLESRVFAV